MKQYCTLLFFIFSLMGYSQEKFEIFFDFNKDSPTENSVKNLQKWISNNSKAEISKLYGYCDSVDDNSYNKELSTRRINSVIKILKENNIQLAKNIDLQAFGKNFKASKIQEENRKVTIYYKINPSKGKVITKEEIPSPPADVYAKVAKEKNSLTIKFKNAKIGDKINIENIYFYLDSDKMISKSKPLLEEIYAIMSKNPKLKIQINGHICCNNNAIGMQLSTQRALFIYAYLLDKEILLNRLTYKGFGSSLPIYKIPEKNEEERLANRRVEILIVDK